ncbi:MAG: hypothetical protein Q4B70_05445, partial [Lachnospiraceae bacterium]|nr:hypothetical protein [Lachnospiraceae bacterium]
MLQRIITDTMWMRGFAAIAGIGLIVRLITILSYRRMRTAAENAGKTKKRWILTLKKRYENYEKFDRMGNIEVFVDRFFERKGIMGIPLRIWDKAVLQLALFGFLMGITGGFYSYIMGIGTSSTVTTLFTGVLISTFLLLLHNIGGTEVIKEQVITALKDYLSNGTAHRTAKEPLREKQENRKREVLPTREEVESIS